MDLTILEILTIQQLLPQTGSLINLRLMRKVREDLSFSNDELETHNLVDDGNGNVTWTVSDFTKEFNFESSVANIIVAALKKLDAEEKLEERHVSLFEKFTISA